MYIEPLFDASEAAGPDCEPALAEQLGHFVRDGPKRVQQQYRARCPVRSWHLRRLVCSAR